MKKNLTLVAEVLIYLIAGYALSFPSTLPAANEEKELDSEEKSRFMDALESLRKKCRIPGMSVAVVRKQEVVLAQGFGFADVENGVPATENTPYNIASCTKPIAAVVLMKLVEAGRLDLDDAMGDILKDTVFPFRYRGEACRGYAAFFERIGQIINDPSSPLASELGGSYRNYRHDTERITIRHHLTHTSENVPGEDYRYNGDLYSYLSLVVMEASGKPFCEFLVDEVIRPLEMDRTVPSISRENRERVLAERSKYYRVGRNGKFTRLEVERPIKWPDAFKKVGLEIDSSFLVNAGAGMVSTVLDLARFDIALDRNRLISESTKKTMFTPTLSNSGRRLPYGLGWFIQDFKGVRLIWHYGYGGDYSSLILKVPGEGITLILLANSGGASSGFDLGGGHEPENVLKSPFAALFIESFTDMVLPVDCANLAVYPGDDWRKAESPEELGWSSEKLAGARAYSESIGSAAVMIVDDGVVVDSWGDVGREYNCHSMRKSLLSGLYGIYVDKGMIDLSKTLSDLGVDDHTPLTKSERKATVADLIKARSGIYIPAIGESQIMSANRPSRGSHKPGTFWYYNNWDFNALGTIFDSETGVKDIYHAFKRNIADPVGMQDFDAEKQSYSRSPDSKHPYYGFRMTTRDLARFGLLFLHEGRWEENQIIPSAWIRESTASHSRIGPGSGYGYMWWTGVKGGLFPNVEVKGHSYYASGASGHWLIVLPFRNLVVVHRVDSDNPGNEVYEPQMGTLLWLILAAAGETGTGEPPYMDWAPGRRLAGENLKEIIAGSTLKARVAGREVALTFKRDGGLLFSLDKLVIPTTWETEGDQLCLNLPSGLGGRFKAVKDEDTVSVFDLQGLLYFRFDYSRN